MVFDLLKNNLFFKNKVIIYVVFGSQRARNQSSKDSLFEIDYNCKKYILFFLRDM